MQIDWPHFSPWTSLSGGALLGLSCALLFLVCGRIAGVSGIVGGLLRPCTSGTAWRLAFVVGIFLAPTLWHRLVPGGLPAPRLFVASVEQLLPFAVGGLLVGFGTRLANGCTSGHGICGLARRSRRSLVAVGVFMGAAALVVFAVRHIGGVVLR